MPYPQVPDFERLIEQIRLYSQLRHEQGAKNIRSILKEAEKDLSATLAKLKKLPIEAKRKNREPDDLENIKPLRPKGDRRLWSQLDKAVYVEKLEGAFLGRMAGCTLGAPVEFYSIDRMKALAKENKDPFPPRDYWQYVPSPYLKRYGLSKRESYTRSKMNGVPVDDDITYTLLGLLIMEEFGPDFSVEDVGKAWLKYLPYAATAEDIALRNLKRGVPALKAGQTDNPFQAWIGADIRSDPWGYMAPGWPEKAAELAYRDAYISHRGQGIYGAMYFAAVISAAFAVDHPIEALELGLAEIPRNCALARAVRWALKTAPRIHNFQQAREAVEDQFRGNVHTINNACLTIWGITIGGPDFTRVIGTTVAMGMDNDCTAATAGSIVGAVLGKKGIPLHWYRNFNNTVHSYLIGKRRFTISGLVKRFTRQAAIVYKI